MRIKYPMTALDTIHFIEYHAVFHHDFQYTFEKVLDHIPQWICLEDETLPLFM